MEDKTTWKDVAGYEGYYVVNKNGVVKSVERFVPQYRGLRHIPEKIKETHINPYGYPCVTLCKDGKSRSVPIHIILAKAFIPNPENKPCIDHIDTNKQNYAIENLRWVTPKENANNPITLVHLRENAYTNEANERRIKTRKERGGKTAPKNVYQYDMDGNFIKMYENSRDAQRKTCVQASSIRDACRGLRYSAGGFLWSYKMEQISYNVPTHTNAKSVLQYDKEGNFIREWESLAAVCKVYGSTPSNLSKSIKRRRFRGKYIWTFKE